MKKAIICSGLAIVLAFTNVSMANNAESTSTVVTREYKVTTPLGVAISKGDVATVKKMLEYGASVHEKCNGMTPLMIAARYNQSEIITLLLEKGANVKDKDEKGLTALKHAEASNAKEAVALLKQANA
ncbi:ankyrin repeat domain-containing protein [Flavobacterium suzhouense]|uniref:Ankyrin repeat domain-containing protein n=1 Tax=Flavobacterium suzhouense TaxID=1529638 RepID=A0ABW5NVU6_9FLAO